jgi:hypothetical protein
MSKKTNIYYIPPKATVFDVMMEGYVCASGIDSSRDGYDFVDDPSVGGWS